jgi:DNA-binding CsgD family transcriptional regulator
VTLVDQLYLWKFLDKPLTTSEMEALQAVADGDRSADVAARNGTTAATVKTTVWRAMQKLGADTRSRAVALGFRKGILR